MTQLEQEKTPATGPELEAAILTVQDNLVSVQGAAEIFGIDVQYMRQLLHKNTRDVEPIEVYEIFGRKVFSTASVEKARDARATRKQATVQARAEGKTGTTATKTEKPKGLPLLDLRVLARNKGLSFSNKTRNQLIEALTAVGYMFDEYGAVISEPAEDGQAVPDAGVGYETEAPEAVQVQGQVQSFDPNAEVEPELAEELTPGDSLEDILGSG